MTYQIMRAVTYNQPGPPDMLTIRRLPRPACPVDGVLISVEAAAIEGGDLIRRAEFPPDYPDTVLGYAAAGTVIEIGTDVADLQMGQRVVAVALNGSQAEVIAAPAAMVWPIPDTLDTIRASIIPISFGTAHHCLIEAGGLRMGETVLIQAGAGGVGNAMIQIAHRAGAKVIATVRGAERPKALEMLGLDLAIDYTKQDVASAVRQFNDGQLADLVIDPVGGATLGVSLAALREQGRLVFVGNAGGGSIQADLWPAMQANQCLSGVFMGPLFATEPTRLAVHRLIRDVADEKYEVLVDRTFSFSDVAQAHAYIEEGQILVP